MPFRQLLESFVTCNLLLFNVAICTLLVSIIDLIQSVSLIHCNDLKFKLAQVGFRVDHWFWPVIYLNLALAHSLHSMVSGPSVMKPFPTRDVLQSLQRKQSLCQLLSSNVTNLVPPSPVIAWVHAKHFLANNSP